MSTNFHSVGGARYTVRRKLCVSELLLSALVVSRGHLFVFLVAATSLLCSLEKHSGDYCAGRVGFRGMGRQTLGGGRRDLMRYISNADDPYVFLRGERDVGQRRYGAEVHRASLYEGRE